MQALEEYDYKQHAKNTQKRVRWLIEELNVRVFPLHIPKPRIGCSCGRASCKRPGKHPKTLRGFKDSTADLESALRQFTNPANIGVKTGEGLIVVDVDAQKGGIDSLKSLELTNKELPDTYTVLTGNGFHLYFRCTVPVPNSADSLGSGLDVRGDGGYVVAEDSLHQSGKNYVIDTGQGREVADAPAWLIGLIERTEAAKSQVQTEGDAVIEGGRNVWLTSLAGALRYRGCEEEDILEVLKIQNLKRCKPPLPDKELERIAKSVSKYSPDEASNPTSWKGLLKRSGKNKTIKATASNCAILLSYMPELADKLAYNEHSDKVLWTGSLPDGFMRPEKGSEFDGSSELYLQNLFSKRVGPDFSTNVIAQAARQVSKRNTFNPLVDYLQDLVWDNVPRIGSWLTTYLGAPDTSANRAMGRKWLISAVARAMDPGCQADHCLILEGPQGLSKSTVCRILGGHRVPNQDWYLDMQTSIDNQYAGMALQGYWIVELGELDALRSTALSKIKQFMTLVSDVYKVPYDKAMTDRPRRCVFIGTTNEYNYLDSEQRRFWPVRCGKFIDTSKLREDRDQLWAEAVSKYTSGEPWWMDDTAMSIAVSTEQRRRLNEDPWEAPIFNWLVGRQLSFITTFEIMRDVLDIRDVSKQDQKASSRISRIMKNLGWMRTRKAPPGSTRKVTSWLPTPTWEVILAERED